MKKKIRIFFTEVTKEIDIDDDIDEEDKDNYINRIVYEEETDLIKEKTEIDFWEEV